MELFSQKNFLQKYYIEQMYIKEEKLKIQDIHFLQQMKNMHHNMEK